MNESEFFLSLQEPSFLYGGTVYETLRSYEGRILAGKYHYERLEKSASYIGCKVPISYEEFKDILNEAVEKLGQDISIRVLLLPKGKISAFEYSPESSELIVYASVLNLKKIDKVTVKISKVRKIDPSATPADFKSTGRTDILLAKASKGNAYDVLMLGSKGQLCEGTFTNVFIVKDSKVITPDLESGILPGITRKNVIQMCKEYGIPIEERQVELSELFAADEVFLTHTSRGIVPVDEIDGWRAYKTSFGKQLSELFETYIKKVEENWL
ncbi:aminotransferase class IV [Pseudothermotoga thermarum]|uniref:Aminotransferase class IV n=1 Tax=Pseudothermotoga thermarum DSM 5069 TaxID=688269 RepID=F7YUA9_9THEM|nr:aminotransferase class IV [Pseudothermotoga thermarum]AEH51308.1 aminotransferase class IV [Pseudothermotoga thermarum DSM 5069]